MQDINYHLRFRMNNTNPFLKSIDESEYTAIITEVMTLASKILTAYPRTEKNAHSRFRLYSIKPRQC